MKRMKTLNVICRRGLFGLLGILFLVQCSGPKKVRFEIPVDTRDKPISLQTKRKYEFKEMGVWVGNEFDGARLNGAFPLNDSTIALRFDPENTPINKSPYYAFETGSDTSKTIYFKFEYPDGFEHRYEPKRKQGGKWSIIDSVNVLSADEGIFLKLKLGSEPQIVAAQEINTSTDVEQWYMNRIVEPHDFVKLKSAGQSTMGRNLPVLELSFGEVEDKPIVVLLTRQHPPEVTGFFAFQHFLEALVGQGTLTQEFLKKYRVLAFPIMNPDGVDLGHWRHNANGVDLNRDWSKYHQQEIKNVVSYVTAASKMGGSIVLGLDFHSTYEDVFYTNVTREGTSLPNFISDWFEVLERDIPSYVVNEKPSNSTRPVSKGWFLYGQNATGITYEIGDHTPKERIAEIGTQSAIAMMEILLKGK
ncbi:M14 family metallopeptidase [Flagellimonas flava]|uniref:Zinc carboxypeptidase n=1 Tax=Flagellimonas flava TaxID=570519 RepID=A0A1M5MXG6_9FLAO|nr:M14 family metallopeptidase [Allomuricauda flava]SHG81971.1 Zinc carboxypeptidase [Allomuricauda flava]